jgi:hypothetical protein
VLDSIIVDKVGNVFFVAGEYYATPNGETFGAWHYDKRTNALWNIISVVEYEYALRIIGLYRDGEA